MDLPIAKRHNIEQKISDLQGQIKANLSENGCKNLRKHHKLLQSLNCLKRLLELEFNL